MKRYLGQRYFGDSVGRTESKDSFTEGLVCLDRNIFAPWARGKYTHLPSHHYKTGWEEKRRKTSHKAYQKEIIPRWIHQAGREPGIHLLSEAHGDDTTYHSQTTCRACAAFTSFGNYILKPLKKQWHDTVVECYNRGFENWMMFQCDSLTADHPLHS